MTDARTLTDRFFFEATGMDANRVTNMVTRGLHKADGGELFLQRAMTQSMSWSDGELESNHAEIVTEGYGLRFISGLAADYANSDELSEDSIKRSLRIVKEASESGNKMGNITLPARSERSSIYTFDSPLNSISEQDRIQLLSELDRYARAKDPRVVQVNAAIASAYNLVTIIRRDGERFDDIRPVTTVRVSVVMQEGGRRESGKDAFPSRLPLNEMFKQKTLTAMADRAIQQADTLLKAVPAPAGEMPVVVGPGWGGVLLHEAIGHGLEGDAARLETTVFKKEFIGQKVASDGVTIIDQGDIKDARGCLNFDDEGTPTQENILVENGVLRGYMQDLINSRAMGVAPTGNGRRESFMHKPIPRMTTTFMKAGNYDPREIIESVDRGIYVVDFAGGQVDPTSGDYVFAATEAYLIEGGKIVTPVTGATLIGNSLRSMKMVDMVGNDLKLNQQGTCGKDGQGVPVGIGQPTIKMRGVKVGGTDLG